jgi:VIT1/CCC1 family predicted Fe2+/Mn2+ transporter
MLRLRSVVGHAPGYQAVPASGPSVDEGVAVIILGVILLILGYVLGIGILTTVGWILVVVGLILTILGAVGRPVGGRKTYL